MPLSSSHPPCLNLCPPRCLSTYLPPCLSACLPPYLSAYLPPCLSTSLLFCPLASLPLFFALQVRLCFEGTLDPTKCSGKIVVCDRGETPLITKAREVQAAGGAGAIVANVEGGETTQLPVDYNNPSVNLRLEEAQAVKRAILGAAS